MADLPRDTADSAADEAAASDASPDPAPPPAADDPGDGDRSTVPEIPSLSDVCTPRLLVVALAVAVALALLAGGVTSSTAFGAFNPSWDGTSELRTLGEETGGDTLLLRDVGTYDDLAAGQPTAGSPDAAGAADTTADAVPANRTLAVVLSPRTAYENPAPVRRFVERGGTLLVAEDVGPHGNALLAAVGATARVDGRLVRDERTHGPSPAFPAAPNVSNQSYATGVDALELNHGTAVEPGNATVLAATSPYAYLDENGNDALDDDETLAASPVATVEPVGDGTVAVVGDPSLFVNAMLDARDNRAFVRGLAGQHDRVALDTSHSGGVPALVSARLAVVGTPWLQVVAGGVGVLAVALAPGVIAIARRRRSGPEAEFDGESDRRSAHRPARTARGPAHSTDTVMGRRMESSSNDRSE